MTPAEPRGSLYDDVVVQVNVELDEALNNKAEAAAARRGMSKTAFIQAVLADALEDHGVSEARRAADEDEPTFPAFWWDTFIGKYDSEPVDDIDEFLYGPSNQVR